MLRTNIIPMATIVASSMLRTNVIPVDKRHMWYSG